MPPLTPIYRRSKNRHPAHFCLRALVTLRAAVSVGLLAASTLTLANSTPATEPGCVANPLGTRDLYLRGSFNAWTTIDNNRFTYVCNRFELITKISGIHTFKIADNEWSEDANFGARTTNSLQPNDNAPAIWPLAAKGADLRFAFQGTHRIVLDMSQPKNPILSIASCPAAPPSDVTLFVRGTMNNWTASDDYAFTHSCDAYYLNVKLQGRQEFKIADAAWGINLVFGGNEGRPASPILNQPLSLGKGSTSNAVGNISFNFDGEQTLRMDVIGDRRTLTIGAKSFADPKHQAITNLIALSVRHDSQQLADKSPYGAVPAGTPVKFAINANKGIKKITLVIEKRQLDGNQEILKYTEIARLPMAEVVANGAARWTAVYSFNEVSIYGYYFEVDLGDVTFIYQNNRNAIYWTRETGTNGKGLIEEVPYAKKAIRRFRHTVFARDFTVPDWTKDVVYYHIFPDRFRNGDATNDHRVGVDTYHDKAVEVHKNWLDKPFKPGSGDGSDDAFNNDFFGGDIAGIIEKLDYIAELGANTLYITPLFRASSNHKYDTADFTNIDPHFGTNADFEKLTREAAKRKIRVIPDTSLNHVGSDSIYFDRFEKYKSGGAFEGAKVRESSPYSSWFVFDKTQSIPDRQYKGWVDVTDLPELNKSSANYRNFAYGATDSVMKLWLDRGAAGWRMDVVPWVPDDFWREWRRAIKQHRPDALTVAETWFDASKYFLGDTFDSSMNYIFRNTVLDYAVGGNATKLYSILEFIREVYPVQTFYSMMNLLSSHDVARSMHVFGHTGDKTSKETIELAKQRLRLAVFFQMTYPGAPTIYYGDEVGVTGGDDPYNRATYPWADKGGQPDTALLADFKALVKIRNDHPVLRRGSLDAPIFIDANVVVLARNLDNQWAITATNNSPVEKNITITLPNPVMTATFMDVRTGKKINSISGTLQWIVPSMFGTVLVTTN